MSERRSIGSRSLRISVSDSMKYFVGPNGLKETLAFVHNPTVRLFRNLRYFSKLLCISYLNSLGRNILTEIYC